MLKCDVYAPPAHCPAQLQGIANPLTAVFGAATLLLAGFIGANAIPAPVQYPAPQPAAVAASA